MGTITINQLLSKAESFLKSLEQMSEKERWQMKSWTCTSLARPTLRRQWTGTRSIGFVDSSATIPD